MYVIEVTIRGTAPLLQNRYPMPTMEEISTGGKKRAGVPDYTEQWREALYSNDDGIYQPASHIEASMVKAAVNFKIPGKRGKTYKDLFKSAVFVKPDAIPHGIPVPEELTSNEKEPLYIDARPVVVQRARVVRFRPAFSVGWKLDFEIECLEDEISFDLIQDVLETAGKSVGIGDFRPRFGRFNIEHFKETDGKA